MVASVEEDKPEQLGDKRGMPEQLSDWGCDKALWDAVPHGAKRDLRRYLRTGKEDLARNRMATMREIGTFVKAEPGAIWEGKTWHKGVMEWEADNLAAIEAENARIKAEKKAGRAAKAKAQKEAKAQKLAEEEAAKEEEAGDFQ
eukprot:CAMPEP_0194136884 /NCGR_PEP_ID=MMETSP0152-20130528/6833_1 /TAXON_ID=1049557 /ORGANISM="Thalassiothrix antarctica, Strain L6-D1" /LENGTH=143 /DNA_ID=CAMNT_0038833687 /DNA_START=236 /DNA_END=667 /DNA_ORIENTATION=-